MTVTPENTPLFDERATNIEIVDESGGEFVAVSQCTNDGHQKICIDPEEWPTIREAIEVMIGKARTVNESE